MIGEGDNVFKDFIHKDVEIDPEIKETLTVGATPQDSPSATRFLNRQSQPQSSLREEHFVFCQNVKPKPHDRKIEVFCGRL